jgi:hypothetical protein
MHPDCKRLSLPDVIDQFSAYYARPENRAWGSLHVVLDDGNYEDSSVRYCIEWARECGDEEGVRLAELLLKLSRTQRSKVDRLVWAKKRKEERHA